jgi:hypothetical protein
MFDETLEGEVLGSTFIKSQATKLGCRYSWLSAFVAVEAVQFYSSQF